MTEPIFWTKRYDESGACLGLDRVDDGTLSATVDSVGALRFWQRLNEDHVPVYWYEPDDVVVQDGSRIDFDGGRRIFATW